MVNEKRKITQVSPNGPIAKKGRQGSKLNPAYTSKSTSDRHDSIKSSFAEHLFDDDTKRSYADQYASSEPYTHTVIQPLISDSLLRSVRSEALENLHFTRKETDIYRIHQSGDLANLSGLPSSALKLLPSLLQLRNALYSKTFRNYISDVTNCGNLSGKKTDMAINVYTKGCHLLCHDDVIGSRRVSYILYLTDPDDPWQSSWGGGLRLYPTTLMEDGTSRVPSADWSKTIPPAWNQLSLFEVQPGHSFHDVEEVYEEGKIRMAISGWFHIPQEGEEGYIKGEEERLAEKSSLQQLQSKSDVYDLPQSTSVYFDGEETPKDGDDDDDDDDDDDHDDDDDDEMLTELDCDFLLKYMNPTYLTPDTLEDLADEISSQSSIQLANFLSKAFLKRVKAYIKTRDGKQDEKTKREAEKEGWKVAIPPHKHRYMYLQDDPKPAIDNENENGNGKGKGKEKAKGKGKAKAKGKENGEGTDHDEDSPLLELVHTLFPSRTFRKLLQIATGLKVASYHDVLARRFRRGLDYTLATGWEADASNERESSMRIELCLGLTPSDGWEPDVEAGEAGEEADTEVPKKGNGTTTTTESSSRADQEKIAEKIPTQQGPFSDEGAGVGGYEMYMAGDDDNDEDGDNGDEDAKAEDETNKDQVLDASGKRNKKKQKTDPAVYKVSSDDEDEAMLFSMTAAWNRLSIVLRDGGLLKFTKYVSKDAKGDRWDVVGAWGVSNDGNESGDDGMDVGDDEEAANRDGDDQQDEWEEWHGIEE